MATDWYRNEIWNEEIEAMFEERLKRARPYSRSQYIRIQSVHITKFDKNIAKRLLYRVLNEYPDDDFEMVPTKENLADILVTEGDYTTAEKLYRELLEFESKRVGGGVKSMSEIKLMELILTTKQRDKYREVYEIGKKSDLEHNLLKSVRYNYCYLMAKLCDEIGKKDEAKNYAQLAIDLINDPRPSAPRHPGVGDIHAKDEEVVLLKKLITS